MDDIHALPLVLMGLTAVISLFIPKGNIVNKIMGLVFFIAALACIFAEDWWWNLVYIVGVCLFCRRRPMYRSVEKNLDPVYTWMGLVMMGMIMVHAVIHCLFGWDSFWWLMIIAGIGAYEYFNHLKNS